MPRRRGTVLAVSGSAEKGRRKSRLPAVRLLAVHGIIGDAHAEDGPRQVSLLADESAEKIRSRGLNVGPGDFAENITTSGIEVSRLALGTILKIGDAVLEIIQIGKDCYRGCAIKRLAGDCVMPREGFFARVLRGGVIQAGDAIVIGDGEDD